MHTGVGNPSRYGYNNCLLEYVLSDPKANGGEEEETGKEKETEKDMKKEKGKQKEREKEKKKNKDKKKKKNKDKEMGNKKKKKPYYFVCLGQLGSIIAHLW